MSKEKALEIMMLLSALESHAYSTKKLLPDFLHERLVNMQADLADIVLEQS